LHGFIFNFIKNIFGRKSLLKQVKNLNPNLIGQYINVFRHFFLLITMCTSLLGAQGSITFYEEITSVTKALRRGPEKAEKQQKTGFRPSPE